MAELLMRKSFCINSLTVAGSSFTPFINTIWLPTGIPALASISQALELSGVISHG
ncbi:MAG: hypothetical protein MZV64_62095 [Ignavibacteriales bacterium]|nr:hypothetical protein [Ignavibacteriales bacterium]